MPSLPPEGPIVDAVATGDDSRLFSTKACALVCHSMLPLCRNYIFASVTINAPSSRSPTTDDLYFLLSASSHLAMCIRKLVYHAVAVEFFTEKWKQLALVFKKLVKLETLHISYSVIMPSRKLDWDVTTPEKSASASAPSSDTHQHQSIRNPELSCGRFGRVCQSKRVGDCVFRVFVWCWAVSGGISHHTGDP